MRPRPPLFLLHLSHKTKEVFIMTELVFILDRSGSMYGLEKDTIGGFNSMLEKQKAEAGEAYVTTVLFDNYVEFLHDRLPLHSVSPMTEKEYFVRSSTALLDAIGSTIQHIAGCAVLLLMSLKIVRSSKCVIGVGYWFCLHCRCSVIKFNHFSIHRYKMKNGVCWIVIG